MPEEKTFLLGVNLALEQDVVAQPDQLVLGPDHEHGGDLDVEEGGAGELPGNVLRLTDVFPGIRLADVLDPQHGCVLLSGLDVAHPAALPLPPDLRLGVAPHHTGEDGLLPRLHAGVLRRLQNKRRDWKYLTDSCGQQNLTEDKP